MKYSKTKLIRYNRRLRVALDVLIDSMKKGLYDSQYSGDIFNTRMLWSKTCRKKSCSGNLEYDMYSKKFHCSVCFKVQELVYVSEERVLKDQAKITDVVESSRDIRVKELEKISQYLRNLYRITVDNLDCPEPSAEQQQEAKKIHNEIHSIIDRNSISISLRQFDYVYSIVKNNKILKIGEIDELVKETNRKTTMLLWKLQEQFTMNNVIKLVVLNPENQPNRNKLDYKKAEEIILSTY